MASSPEVQQRHPAVLLAEDDEPLRRALARALRLEGFTVVEAENGAVAFRMLQALCGSVDLVLTDLTMPVMDGIELAKALRTAYPGIPILFMSGDLPRASEGIHLLEVGACLLLKPFGPDVLLDAVTTTLSHEHGSAHRTA
jgi:two-component system cell cycle sensor histidine kinase/response regulator CckA